MKILILTLSFSFLFSFQNAFSQIDKNVLTKSEGKFYFQDSVYKKKELGEVFKLDEASLKYYKKHRKAKKVFNFSTISTVVLAVGGTILFSDDNGGNHGEGDKCYEFCPHQEVGIVMILASWLTTTSSIISLGISRKNFKKAKKSFRVYSESVPKLGSHSLELNLNYTGNGLGIVLNF